MTLWLPGCPDIGLVCLQFPVVACICLFVCLSSPLVVIAMSCACDLHGYWLRHLRIFALANNGPFAMFCTPRVALRIDMWPTELHRACYSAMEDSYSSTGVDGYAYCIFCQVPIESSAADWGLSLIDRDANTWRFQGECPECYTTSLIACDSLPRDYIERRVVLITVEAGIHL